MYNSLGVSHDEYRHQLESLWYSIRRDKIGVCMLESGHNKVVDGKVLLKWVYFTIVIFPKEFSYGYHVAVTHQFVQFRYGLGFSKDVGAKVVFFILEEKRIEPLEHRVVQTEVDVGRLAPKRLSQIPCNRMYNYVIMKTEKSIRKSRLSLNSRSSQNAGNRKGVHKYIGFQDSRLLTNEVSLGSNVHAIPVG